MKAHTNSSGPHHVWLIHAAGGMMEYRTTKGDGNVLPTLPHYYKEDPPLGKLSCCLFHTTLQRHGAQTTNYSLNSGVVDSI
jgi:hypothetical protein